MSGKGKGEKLDELMMAYADLSAPTKPTGFKGPPVKEIRRDKVSASFQPSSKARDWRTLDQSLEDAFISGGPGASMPSATPFNSGLGANLNKDLDQLFGPASDNASSLPVGPSTAMVGMFSNGTNFQQPHQLPVAGVGQQQYMLPAAGQHNGVAGPNSSSINISQTGSFVSNHILQHVFGAGFTTMANQPVQNEISNNQDDDDDWGDFQSFPPASGNANTGAGTQSHSLGVIRSSSEVPKMVGETSVGSRLATIQDESPIHRFKPNQFAGQQTTGSHGHGKPLSSGLSATGTSQLSQVAGGQAPLPTVNPIFSLSGGSQASLPAGLSALSLPTAEPDKIEPSPDPSADDFGDFQGFYLRSNSSANQPVAIPSVDNISWSGTGLTSSNTGQSPGPSLPTPTASSSASTLPSSSSTLPIALSSSGTSTLTASHTTPTLPPPLTTSGSGSVPPVEDKYSALRDLMSVNVSTTVASEGLNTSGECLLVGGAVSPNGANANNTSVNSVQTLSSSSQLLISSPADIKNVSFSSGHNTSSDNLILASNNKDNSAGAADFWSLPSHTEPSMGTVAGISPLSGPNAMSETFSQSHASAASTSTSATGGFDWSEWAANDNDAGKIKDDINKAEDDDDDFGDFTDFSKPAASGGCASSSAGALSSGLLNNFPTSKPSKDQPSNKSKGKSTITLPDFYSNMGNTDTNAAVLEPAKDENGELDEWSLPTPPTNMADTEDFGAKTNNRYSAGISYTPQGGIFQPQTNMTAAPLFLSSSPPSPSKAPPARAASTHNSVGPSGCVSGLDLEDFQLPSEQLQLSDQELFGTSAKGKKSKYDLSPPTSIIDLISQQKQMTGKSASSKTGEEKLELSVGTTSPSQLRSEESSPPCKKSPEVQSIASLEFDNPNVVNGDNLSQLAGGPQTSVGDSPSGKAKPAWESEKNGELSQQSAKSSTGLSDGSQGNKTEQMSCMSALPVPVGDWYLCQHEILHLLQTALNAITNIQQDVREEVVNSCDGKEHLANLLRLIRIFARIRTAYKSHFKACEEMENVIGEVESTWKVFSSMLDLPLQQQIIPQYSSSVDTVASIALCGVCLLSLYKQASYEHEDDDTSGVSKEAKIIYAGREYHSVCANFWINCIDSSLPSFTL